MHKILLIGPQGAGKGTQSERLSERLKIPAISMGRLLRQIAEQDTSLGQQVRRTIDVGQMLPDEITDKIVRERLIQPDAAAGYILDGFPRRLDQFELFLKIDHPTLAVLITLDDETAIERISGRRTCRQCGRVYHLKFNPPPDNGCSCGGGQPQQRDDDTPAAIKKRLVIYHQETEPLVARYRELGILLEIDGRQSIDEVFESIIKGMRV